ncbi:MAG: amidohydrolase family protein [Dehalococcoidia bacterium]
MAGFTTFASGEQIKVVDMDSHYTEPPDLWTSRAPAKYKDLVPHVERTDAGDQWVVDGDKPFGPLGYTVVRLGGGKERGIASLATFEELDVAAWDPKERLNLLDRLGIYQQIVYPNVAGFGSEHFMDIPDRGLRLSCATIYNDAVAEIQAGSGGRLFPQAIIPFWDIDEAVAEVRRINDMGLKGVAMLDRPQEFGLPYLNEPHWAPFFATCEELQLPVNFHIGVLPVQTSQRAVWPMQSMQRMLAVSSIALFMDNFKVITNLIFTGVLERYPNLKFVSVESGIGWIPFLLEAMDYQFEEAVPSDREGLTMLPSEYFRRQMYASFWFEDFGPRAAIDFIGAGNVMFETDFPHPTCLYPKAQEHIVEVLTDLDPETRRKILRNNAAEVYHLPD